MVLPPFCRQQSSGSFLVYSINSMLWPSSRLTYSFHFQSRVDKLLRISRVFVSIIKLSFATSSADVTGRLVVTNFRKLYGNLYPSTKYLYLHILEARTQSTLASIVVGHHAFGNTDYCNKQMTQPKDSVVFTEIWIKKRGLRGC